MGFQFDLPSINSSINKILNLTYHRMAPSFLSKHSEVEEIDKRLASLREKETMPLLPTSHDIHQYSVIYTMVGFIIGIAIVWTVKRRCATHQVTATATAEPRTENIELQMIRTAPLRPQREEPTYATPSRPQTPPQRHSRKISSAITNIPFKLDNIN